MRRFLLFLLFISLLCFNSNAQNECSKWYFGFKAGLDFMSNPPTAIANSSMSVFEGCSSIADAAGNLLFYTRGDSVYNQQNQMLANGFGLLGNASTSQSALIVKKPGSANIYYIFTMAVAASTLGLNYSTVDMSLAAGLGSVTVKNTPLYSASCTEKLAGTRHCNGVDVWVLIHENNSANFRAYLVTAAGVNTSPVITAVGSSYSNIMFQGCMKFSPNGRKLGAAVQPNFTSLSYGIIELFDFNNSTGVLSNSFTLSPNTISSSTIYDCEFSPDGTKLYSSNIGGANLKVIQWDLCAGSNSSIASSQYTLANSDTSFNCYLRAPNGKIYITRQNMQFLSVINNPNSPGALCNYVTMGPSIAPGTCGIGLPNFVSSLMKSPFSFTQDLSCNTLTFTPPSIASPSLSGCVASGYSVTGMLWNFGEPSSASNNTSTSNNPAHSYSSGGTYNVKLVLSYSGCAPDTILQTIQVGITPTISVFTGSFSCSGLGTATASVFQGPATGQYNYTWTPSAQTGSVANNLSPGIYTVSVKAVGGTCISTSTTNIALPSNSLQSVASYTPACNMASAQVTVSGGSGTYSYSWSPGSQTTSSVNGLAAGVYSVIITDVANQCSLTKTIQVSVLPLPTLTVSGAGTICVGNSTVLNVSGANTYTWSNSAVNGSIAVNPTISTIYTVTGTNTLTLCSDSKTLVVTVSKCLSLNESGQQEGVRVFPNPVNKLLTLEMESDAIIVITNQLGMICFEAILLKGINPINVADFSEGVYFLSLQNGFGSKTLKFVKLRVD